MTNEIETWTQDEESGFFEYLDDLRESGITNMYGAAPYLMGAFWIEDGKMAQAVLSKWMRTFGKRHPR